MVIDSVYLQVILLLLGQGLLKHEQCLGLKNNMSTMLLFRFQSRYFEAVSHLVSKTIHGTRTKFLVMQKQWWPIGRVSGHYYQNVSQPAPLISIISLRVFKQEDKIILE